MAGPGRVWLKGLAQPPNELVWGPCVDVARHVPHVLQQLPARDDAAFVLHEVPQQLHFHLRHPRRFAPNGHLKRLEVDLRVAEGELAGRDLRLRSLSRAPALPG